MKRNDDGYVLPLVLVVLLVLGIVVSSVLAASLQNLRFQNNSIARTEARCEAEGVVEIVKAQVLALVGEESEAETKDSVSSSEIKKELKDTKKMCEAVKAKLAEIQSIVLNPDINKSGLTISIAIKDDNWSETVEATSAKFAFPLLIKAIDSSGSTVLRCEMKVDGTIQLNEPEEEGKPYTCEIENIQVEYVTYEIGGAA